MRGAPAIGIAAAWGVVLAARATEAANGAEALAKLELAMVRLMPAPDRGEFAWARWRACAACCHWQARIGAKCWNAKRGQSKPKTSLPITQWAHRVRP